MSIERLVKLLDSAGVSLGTQSNPLVVTSDGSATVIEGGVQKAKVTDSNLESLLERVVKELKIMNFHLSLITDNAITKSDVE